MSSSLLDATDRALLALQTLDLVAISACSRSPQAAFEFAQRIGWSEQEAHSAEALAGIYFTFGQHVYEEIVTIFAPGASAKFCLRRAHRFRMSACCDSYVADCFCACHFCADCNDEHTVRQFCSGCHCHEAFEACDRCEDRHETFDDDEDEDQDDWNDEEPYDKEEGAEVQQVAASFRTVPLTEPEPAPTASVITPSRHDWHEPLPSAPPPTLPPPQVPHPAEVEEKPRWVEPQSDEHVTEDDKAATVTREEHVESAEERLRRVTARLNAAAKTGFGAEIVCNINGDLRQGIALPEGKLQITREAVEVLSEDELAYIVGHEIAHLKHEDHQRALAYADALANETTAALSNMDEALRAGGAGFIKRALATTIVGGLALGAGYVDVRSKSREHESEADDESLNLMCDAGYDPAAAAPALRKIHGGRLPSLGLWDSIRSTHPLPYTRASTLEQKARDHKKHK